MKKPLEKKTSIKAVKTERKNFHSSFIAAIASLKSIDVRSYFGDKKEEYPNTKLIDLPWVLILGESQSGKTTLLSRSSAKSLLAKKNNMATTVITRTPVCEWWVSPQAMILDTAGRFTCQDQNDTTTATLWKDFLELLKTQRRSPINALLVTISFERLFSSTVVQQNHLIAEIKRRITDVQEILSNAVPTYLIFTHVDCIAGFSEFFDDLKTIERQQAWGICFTRNQIMNPQRISDTFDSEFDILLSRLNERIITRLHQEPHQLKRALIKEFPMQMEVAKRSISRFLHQLSGLIHIKNSTQLKGIFFTSTMSKIKTHDKLLIPLSKSFDIEPCSYQPPVRHKKTYFIKQLFDEFIFKEAENYGVKPEKDNKLKKILRQFAVLASACAIVLGTFFWSHTIANNMIEIRKVEDYMIKYQILRENNNISVSHFPLATMNVLFEIKKVLDNIQLPLILQVSLDRHYDLKSKANRAYVQVVKQFVLSELENVLKTQSIKGDQANISLLYGALKAYLSLTDQHHYDPSYTKEWFAENTEFMQSELSIDEIKKHLDLLTQTDFGTVRYNPSLVVQARQAILQAPLSQLSLAILKNNLSHKIHPFKLDLSKNALGLKVFTSDKSYIISGIYTAKYFIMAYENLIPQAVKMAARGDWVVGHSPKNNNTSLNTLLEQTQDLYYHEYMNTWDNMINQLNIVSVDNFRYAIQLIDMLSRDNSSVNQLLKAMRENTSVTYHQIQTPISIHFQPFNRFFLGNTDPNFGTLQYQLQKLQDLLVNVSSGSDSNQMAFQIAKQSFLDKGSKDNWSVLTSIANNSPIPINQWVAQVSENSWDLILQQTSEFIYTLYQQKVLGVYQQKIKPYFPVDKNAKNELRMNDFAQFFGPAGVMDSFYRANLSPFIDTQEPHWQWRKLNDKSLPLSMEFLQAFQRASDIRQAWFDEDPRQPLASFQMEVVALQPIVKSLTITLDGQRTVFKQNTTSISHFVWPSSQGLHVVSAQFASVDGHQAEVMEEGIWGWFKLLNKSTIQSAQADKMTFSLEIGGYGARCLLSSKSPMNPFSPDLLPDFSLPEKA